MGKQHIISNLGYLKIVTFVLNILSPPAHLQAENEVAADALLSDDILHSTKCGAQVGV